MSRVTFTGTTKDGIPVEVTGGWDRPLGYYHLTVTDLRDTEEESVLYSCLDEGMMEFQTNESHKATLARLGIEAPKGFWERADKRLGNTYCFFVDGAWGGSSAL